MAGEGCVQGRGDQGLRARIGARGDASQMVLPCWVPSGKQGPVPAQCVPRGQGWGSCPGEGAQSQPSSSERVGGWPSPKFGACLQPSCSCHGPAGTRDVSSHTAWRGVNYSQTPPFSPSFLLTPPPPPRNLFIPELSLVPNGFKGRFACSYIGQGVKPGGCAGGCVTPAPASPRSGWAPGSPPPGAGCAGTEPRCHRGRAGEV